MKIEEDKPLLFETRRQWRDWLAENHDKQPEAWIVQYKKASGRVSVPYEDAVEESLCFGWVDGKMHGVDELHYVVRFTPRKPKSNWAPSNLARAERMIKAGLMTDAGRRVLPDSLRDL